MISSQQDLFSLIPLNAVLGEDPKASRSLTLVRVPDLLPMVLYIYLRKKSAMFLWKNYSVYVYTCIQMCLIHELSLKEQNSCFYREIKEAKRIGYFAMRLTRKAVSHTAAFQVAADSR